MQVVEKKIDEEMIYDLGPEAVLPEGYGWTLNLETKLPLFETWSSGLKENLKFWAGRAAKEYRLFPYRGEKAPQKIVEDALIECYSRYKEIEKKIGAVTATRPGMADYLIKANQKEQKELMALLEKKGFMHVPLLNELYARY